MGAAFQMGHHGAQTLLEPETGILGSETHSREVRRVAQELPKGNGESQKIVEQQSVTVRPLGEALGGEGCGWPL